MQKKLQNIIDLKSKIEHNLYNRAFNCNALLEEKMKYMKKPDAVMQREAEAERLRE